MGVTSGDPGKEAEYWKDRRSKEHKDFVWKDHERKMAEENSRRQTPVSKGPGGGGGGGCVLVLLLMSIPSGLLFYFL